MNLLFRLLQMKKIIETDWFFSLGTNFCHFQEVPSTQYPVLIIFSFLLSTCIYKYVFSNSTTVCVYVKPLYTILRQVAIERTRFFTSAFFCSEFKLENIYSGVNVCWKSVCGNFYLRELMFADRWKNRKNRKN